MFIVEHDAEVAVGQDFRHGAVELEQFLFRHSWLS
jgi:hypothetical protein